MHKPGEFIMKHLIGVDVGGSHITCACVSAETFELVRESMVRRHVDTNTSVDDVMAVFVDGIRAAAGERLDSISGIGLAFPSPFDWENGVCLITPGQGKFANFYQVNVRNELQRRLPFIGDIGFLNDAACFAVGEYAAGAAKGAKRALAITLGTGFGASFILDGKPVTTGATVPVGGELWDSPYKEGIADDAFSTRGLIAAWKDASGVSATGAKAIADAAKAGDVRAVKLFADFGTRLAGFLTPHLERFGVETLVVGGSIAGSFDLFALTLKQGLKVTVKPSMLGEDAQMVGAATCVAR
jgi:glucokinase